MTGTTEAAPPGRSAFRVLRHRSFALLWVGAFISNIGNWMEAVAVGILVAQSTGRSGPTGLVAAAAFLPNGVFGPIGGALADRMNRKRLMISATIVQTVLAGILCILAIQGTPTPWQMGIILLLAGLAGALGFPSFQAMLPDLVPREELLSAVALSQAQFNLGRIVGPALAGITVSLGGYAWAFGINTVSFVAVIATVAVLRIPPTAARPDETIRATVVDGVRYVRREPGIRLALVTMGALGITLSPFIGLIPAVVEKVYRETGADGKRATSILTTAQGIGALTMALMIGYLSVRLGRRQLLSGVLAILPFAIIAYAQAPNIPVAAVLLAVVGSLYMCVFSSLGAVIQLRAPRDRRGRAMSLLFATLGLTYPAGLGLHGWLGDRIGLRTTTTVFALVFAAAVLFVATTRRTMLRNWDDPVE